jgi:site-specific DNA recombinase
MSIRVVRFVGFARVSTKEQEAEGQSLAVQEKAIKAYVTQEGGHLIKVFCIAESARASEERRVFQEMLAFVEDPANKIDCVVFKAVDRATRNTLDLHRLEALWEKRRIDVRIVEGDMRISDSGGNLMINMLGVLAKHQVQTQAKKIDEARENLREAGKLAYRAPFGYQNTRVGQVAHVVVHPENGPKIRRIFELYAFENLTVRDLIDRLKADGINYTPKHPRFNKAKLHTILKDRTYLGDIRTPKGYRPGTSHQPLIDRATFDRVQARLGDKHYTKHAMAFAGIMTCGECGRRITGEHIRNRYIYYRCGGYSSPGHADRTRMTEAEVEDQVLGFLKSLSFGDPELRDWFREALRAAAGKTQQDAAGRRSRLRAELVDLESKINELFQMRLAKEITPERFSAEDSSLQLAKKDLEREIAAESKDQHAQGEAAVKALELSESLAERWPTADPMTKRLILSTVALNITVNAGKLDVTAASPFDLLVEGGILRNGRSEKI